MKKILLASTALVAFAGAASAEVSISGSAELGIEGGSEMETQVFQDMNVKFTMSGETDGGLTFGAEIELSDTVCDIPNSTTSVTTTTTVDTSGLSATTTGTVTETENDTGNDSNTLAASTTINGSATATSSSNADTVGDSCTDHATNFNHDDGGVTIFVSGDFGTVTVGDTDGAMDWALTEVNVGDPGSINDAETAHAGFYGSYLDGSYDGQIVRYDNTFGDFGVAVSFEMDDTGAKDAGMALGVKYSIDMGGAAINLGLGYQAIDTIAGSGGSESVVGLSASTTLDSGLSAALTYTSGDIDNKEDSSHLGLGVGYSTGALSMHFNYGVFDYGNDTDKSGYGLAVGYDLGGGLNVLAGYGSSTKVDESDEDSFSVGLAMSF